MASLYFAGNESKVLINSTYVMEEPGIDTRFCYSQHDLPINGLNYYFY